MVFSPTVPSPQADKSVTLPDAIALHARQTRRWTQRAASRLVRFSANFRGTVGSSALWKWTVSLVTRTATALVSPTREHSTSKCDN